MLFGDLFRVFGKLRRYRHELCTVRDNLFMNSLQSLQLGVAVWSPDAPVETDNQGPLAQQGFGADLVFMFIGQAELRQLLPRLQDLFHDPGGGHGGGGLLHRFPGFQRQSRFGILFDCVQRVLQAHFSPHYFKSIRDGIIAAEPGVDWGESIDRLFIFTIATLVAAVAAAVAALVAVGAVIAFSAIVAFSTLVGITVAGLGFTRRRRLGFSV